MVGPRRFIRLAAPEELDFLDTAPGATGTNYKLAYDGLKLYWWLRESARYVPETAPRYPATLLVESDASINSAAFALAWADSCAAAESTPLLPKPLPIPNER